MVSPQSMVALKYHQVKHEKQFIKYVCLEINTNIFTLVSHILAVTSRFLRLGLCETVEDEIGNDD